MRTRRAIHAFVFSLAGFAFLAGGAQAAGPASAPAWGVLAAMGPTNIPPQQSEVQRITVEAEEGTSGTFTLTHTSGTGTGTPESKNGGVLSVTKGSNEAKIVSGTYEVGQRLSGTDLATETFITGCSSDCHTANSKLVLSAAATETGSTVPKVFTDKLLNATPTAPGAFHVGDILSGKGISTGTVITEISGTTVITNKAATTSAYTSGQVTFTLSEAATIASDASAEELQGALDAMPGFAPGAFAVEGGPGGEVEHPYFITFGAELADRDVEEFTAVGEGLASHGFVHVFTTVPGGPGTGAIAVLPVNRGGGPSKGKVTASVGPLPAGVIATGEPKGEGWTCTIGGEGATVTCESTKSVAGVTEGPAIKIPVEVTAGAPIGSSAPVTISGGGGGEASYEMPVVVSNEPAAGGVGAFTFGAYEADGSQSTQAGAHPYSTSTEFVLNTVRSPTGKILPAGDAREVLVDLPAGLIGNPLIVPRCPQSALTPEQSFEPAGCPQENAVGYFTPATGFAGTAPEFKVPIMSDIPAYGTAAEFASKIVSPVVALFGYLRSEEDFGVRIVAPNSATQLSTVYNGFTVFYGFPGAAGGAPFFTNASDCAEQARKAPELPTYISTWQRPEEFTYASVPVEPVTGCDKLEFKGGEGGQVDFSFRPTSTQGSSPVGVDAHLHLDQSGLTDPNKLAAPVLKKSVVKLPQGLTINPSQANGLEACSEAQIGYKGAGELPNPTRFDNNPAACPDGSKLGTAEATSPLLEEPLKGTIYLARQEENPFHSLIGIYLVFENPRFGITLKLPGKVELDPVTGQVSAVFDYLPQQPVGDFTLHFRGGGPKSEFATPEVCGKYSTDGAWEPWSAPESGPPAQTKDTFDVSNNCASSAGSQPFSPSFEAGTQSALAGAYSPLVIKVDRKDGEQELKNLEFTLPPGVSGKLAGIPYCPDAQIAEAEHKTGKQEQASPSCPSASQVGTVDTSSGVGSEPFHVGGKVYLAGPYKGAPLSSVVVTPAVAGPFDLGDVVIRAPLYVNPETAQLTAKSDPIPTILRGIPLKVRSVTVDIDRSGFTLNPTSCEVMSATASLGGSGGATASPSNRFQVGGCENLPFKPQLKLQVIGKTNRNAKPKFKAVLTAKPGEANIARAQVNLPHSEFLEQNHIKTVCTRVQFAEGDGNGSACPAGSIYGHAAAWTPLLEKPLEGNVYLRSNGGERKLPDLVAALDGQIDVALWGKVDSGKNSGIRSTFQVVPDAPVSRFVVEMNGGKKGLLVNSEELCSKKAKRKAIVRFTGQNGKVEAFKPKVQAQCKKHKEQKKHHKKNGKK